MALDDSRRLGQVSLFLLAHVRFPWAAAALSAVYTLGGRVADAVPLLMQALEQTITAKHGRSAGTL
jgi:hypothetical protein